MIDNLILDPRPELPSSAEWDKLLQKAASLPETPRNIGLYRRLWTLRSAGAVIGNGRIQPGLWTQEDWDEIAKPRLSEYGKEIKQLMEGIG